MRRKLRSSSAPSLPRAVPGFGQQPPRSVLVTLIIAVTVVLVTAAPSAALIDLTIFGPKRYDRLKGKPTVYTDAFDGCSSSAAQGIIKVTNGDSKKTRIKSARIYVNGGKVASEKDFKHKIPSFEKPITLKERNELKVVLKSGHHGYFKKLAKYQSSQAEVEEELARLKALKTELTSSQISTAKIDNLLKNVLDLKKSQNDRESRLDNIFTSLDDDAEDDGDDESDDEDELDSGWAGKEREKLKHYRNELKDTVRECEKARDDLDKTPKNKRGRDHDKKDEVLNDIAKLLKELDRAIERLLDRLAEISEKIENIKKKGPSFLIIEVLGRDCDSTPPVISNPQPPDGSLLNTAAPTISAQYADDQNGTGIDVNSARLSVDGTDVTPAASVSLTGISYTPSTSLPDGDTQVTVNVADKAGNPATLTWNFTIDTTAPAVAITSHQNELYLNTPVITLSGSLDDPSATVTVNGQPAQVTASGFSLSGLALTEEANSLTVVATDPAGNEGTASITLNLDTIAPDTIIGSGPDAVTNSVEADFGFTATEADATFECRLDTAAFAACASPRSFTGLVDGGHTFLVRATDAAGNSDPTPAARTWSVDTVPPLVQITSPTAAAYLNTPSLTVTGTVNEEVASVTVNSIPAIITGNNFSLENIALSEGPTEFLVEARDLAGNNGTQTVTVTLDTIKPAIQVAFPTMNSFVSATSITVSGSVSDAHPAGLWVNDTAVQLENGNFTLAGVALAEGSNTIAVRASDKAGNESVLPVPLTRDTVAPVVTITAPVPNALLKSKQVTVSGTVSELNTTVTVNGSVAQVTGQDFTLEGVALAEGLNDIDVLAKDRAGNPGPASVKVTVDTIAPAPPVLGQPLSPTKMLLTSVTGTAEAGSTVEVSATGPDGLSSVIGTVTADTQGGFTVPGITLVEGTTSFTATASDAAGNSSIPSVPVLVTLDTVPPVITVTAPVNNLFTGTTGVLVTGSIDDPGAKLTIAGIETPLTGAGFEMTVTLTEGLNSILLIAVDAAGNDSSITVLVTLDTVLPVVTITAPMNNALVNASQVAVAGTVSETFTTVTVNGLAALVSGQSFSVASFTLSEGLNEITVEARDRAGNAGSSVVKVTLDGIAPEVSLTAPAQAAAGSTVALLFSALDTGGLRLAEVTANNASLWSFSPNEETAIQNTISYALSPDLAQGSEVRLQGRAYDVAGNMGTASARVVITQGPSGPGYIQGEVYDDSKGLRLAGALITVLSSGTTVTSQITPGDGSYFFEAPAGDYAITVAKEGYSSVDRLLTVGPEKKSIALDARLTPVSGTRQEIGQAGGRAVALLSAPSTTSAITIALDVPAGALTEQTDIRLTPVSNQGLAAILPAGWSPLGIIDIRPFAAEGTEITGGTSFAVSGLLAMPAFANPGLAPAASVAVVRYDAAVRQWIAQAPGVVSSSGTSVTASIPSTGQYALVLPDDASCGAVPASAIAQCGPSPSSILAALTTSPTASGRVVPPAAPASKGVKALGELVLGPVDGTATALVSGTVVNATVTERFDLLTGDALVPSEYVQDLLLFRRPCVTNQGSGSLAQGSGFSLHAELSEPNSGKVGASFPVSPSKEYTIAELLLGNVGLAISLSTAEAGGTLVGPDGGRILDNDGNVLNIPAGALGQTAPVRTRTLAPAAASGIVGSDFTLLRAVDLELSGRTLAASAELSIPLVSGLDPGLPLVVARAFEVKGVQRLKLAALARVSGSLITSYPFSDPSVSSVARGVVSSGMYFFLQAKAPLGFVAGTVLNASSAPFPGAFVATNTCSLADLAAGDGKYLAASRVSSYTATATDIAKNDRGSAAGSIAAAGQIASLDLVIQIVRPQVLSAVPSLLDKQGKAEPNTAVVVTFSEPVNSSTITTATVAMTNAAGETLKGVFSMNPEGTVVMFYPEALLASQATYTITVSQTVQDLQGYTMAAAYQAGFTVRDTTPPPMPAPGSITASFPDAEGYVTVTGTYGSAEYNSVVLIINDTSGEIVSVMPNGDGSFSGRIMAQLGDEIKIMLMDAAGNQTLVSYITFKSDDWKYLVTAKGGIVEGEGGLKLEIPEGVLYGPTVVRITSKTEAQLPADNPLPSIAQFLAGVNIEAGGLRFKKEVKLSVPVPAGMPAGAEPFVSRPAVHKNPDGTEERVYVIEDSAKVINGRLTTASPPFEGIMGPGFYIFQFTPTPLNGPVVISGYTYRNMDGIGGYQPGDAPTADKPVKGALIRGAASYNYVAYSQDDGHYAAYGFSTIDVCRSFYTTAMHPQTMYKHTAQIVSCAVPYIVNNFNFMLADKNSTIPDVTRPVISANLIIAPGQGPEAKFVAGTVPVNTEILVPITAVDQEMGNVTLSIMRSSSSGSATYSAMVSKTSSTFYSYITPDNPVPIYKYSFQADFAPPIMGSQSLRFKPVEAGIYTLTFDATDSSGNSSRKILSIRVITPGPDGTLPGGIDGYPLVDEIVPVNTAEEVMVGTSVIAYFNEPVQNVTSATFLLIDLAESTPQNIVTVPADVSLSFEGGRVKASLKPKGNLVFGRPYEAVLTQGIKDIEPNPSAPAEFAPPLGDGLLPLAKEYRSRFTTKVPQVYDLVIPTINGQLVDDGRDVALFAAEDERVYAYLAAGADGWYVVDVSDPTKPKVISNKNMTAGGTTWSVRGVAVEPDKRLLAFTEDIRYAGGSQYGYIRLYDLSLDQTVSPKVSYAREPRIVGREKLSEQFTGIPGKVELLGDYAYVLTTGTGLQVVDTLAAKKNSAADGSTIVGGFDPINLSCQDPDNPAVQRCGNAADLAVFRGKTFLSALLATASGHLLALDLSFPQVPQLIKPFKPAGYSAWRVAVAAGYGYLDPDGLPQVIDLAVTGSKDGRIHTLDLTDPYNPQILGTATDAQGAVHFGVPATDIAVNKISGLAFVAAGSTVYVIDIKDPANPRLINTLEQALDAGGNDTPLGSSFGLAEREGWVYLANQNMGLRVLNLDPPDIGIEDADPEFTTAQGTAVNLIAKDYYPALGAKTFLFFGFDDERPLDETYELCMMEKTKDFLVAVVVNGAPVSLTPGNCAGQFKTGVIPGKPKRGHIAVNVTWMPEPGTVSYPPDADLHLYAKKKNMPISAQDKLNQCKSGSCRIDIRSNANVTLQNVLDGAAVFAADGIVSTSPGTTPESQGFDFVKELLNQVVPRKRNLVFNAADVNAPNVLPLPQVHGLYVADPKKYPYHSGNTGQSLIDEDGIFEKIDAQPKSPTSQALELFRRNFRIGNTKYNSSTDHDASRTMQKILKDYGSNLTNEQKAKLLYQVVDKETLVGNTRLITPENEAVTTANADVLINGTPGSRNDTGLYELYKNAVERFVDRMLKEADRYAGYRTDTTLGENPTDQWKGRNGEGPGDHGPAVSYSYGSKLSVEQFNAEVSAACYPTKTDENGKELHVEPQLFGVYVNAKGEKVKVPLAASAIPTPSNYLSHPTIVPASYKGNLDDACDIEVGAKKYAGLKRNEFESSKQHGLIGYTDSNKDDASISYFLNYYLFLPPRATFVFPQYGARYWAGIDCSGFIQRSVNSADALSIPGAKSGVDNLGDGTCDAASQTCLSCEEVGSQSYVPNYAHKIYDSKSPIKEKSKALSKVRKGDLAVYKGHVAFVHSDELACGGIIKDKQGKDQINCSYEIIHASGGDTYRPINDKGQKQDPEFSRKVIKMKNAELPSTTVPTGFGRIKLWD